MCIGNGGGGGSDGDDEMEEEEEVEEEEPLRCVICLGSETDEDITLLCCDVKCGHAAHRSCASQRY